MKRSQINTILVDAMDFLAVRGIDLPPFATWSVEELVAKVSGHGCAMIARQGLGWHVTDYGLGEFAKEGMVGFTTRMGDHRQLGNGSGNLYAETHLVMRNEQRMPFVYHRARTKDVINRGTGTLLVRLFHTLESGEHDEERLLRVCVDGQRRELAPGEVVALRAGESVTVNPNVYHEYSASGMDVVISEIATPSDWRKDIFFYDPVAVALEIDEDEQPRHLLVQDYAGRFVVPGEGR